MDQLLEKLAISKAIMDKHNQIKRGSVPDTQVNLGEVPEVKDFSAPVANYNIPQEYLSESSPYSSPSKIPPQNLSKDSILKSKLPDEIKRLMIENPITQTNPMVNESVLSDELVKKATKLMGTQSKNLEPEKTNNVVPKTKTNNNDLKKMIKEAVKEVLRENGLMTESVSESNEKISFRVGQHVFEGVVTKIKKVS